MVKFSKLHYLMHNKETKMNFIFSVWYLYTVEFLEKKNMLKLRLRVWHLLPFLQDLGCPLDYIIIVVNKVKNQDIKIDQTYS